MKVRFPRGAALAAALLAMSALGMTGCASDKIQGVLFPNQRPTVELTNAPVNDDPTNPYFYAYRVNWAGEDPDGRIDHFKFAVDPPTPDEVLAGEDTIW